jgi:iron complex transport system ATP-binding protein
MRLEAQDVSCGYGGEDVLRGVTIGIRPGELVAVAGPNGSGKSTLVRVLSRVLAPRQGRVELEGRDLYGMPPRDCARALAVLPQESAIEFEFTCVEVVELGRAPHLGRFQSEREEDRAAVRSAMERTGTWDLRDRSIVELSGGERQRVFLARAFAQEPRALLLDEPTSHLDLAYQVEILRLARKQAAERDVAVLAVMHDLNLAAAFADRMALLFKGRVAAAGAPADVLREDTLREVYGADVSVRPHPDTGRPYVYVKT